MGRISRLTRVAAGHPPVMIGLALALALAMAPSLTQAHAFDVYPTCNPNNLNQNPNLYFEGPASDWYLHTNASSPYGCHWYTHTAPSGSPVNKASWYLDPISWYDHYYHLHEFIPCDVHSSAHSGHWRRFAQGTAAGYVSLTRTMDGYCDSYLNVDNHNYYGSLGGYIQMLDDTGSGFYVSVDLMRYRQ